MDTVKVKKTTLIDILRNNRKEHRDIFLKAQEKYREEVIKELEASLEDAQKGRKLRRTLTLIEPEDHTRDYDRVIKMLELSVDEEVELSERECMQYVQDEWAWSGQWATTSSAYVKHPKFGNV